VSYRPKRLKSFHGISIMFFACAYKINWPSGLLTLEGMPRLSCKGAPLVFVILNLLTEDGIENNTRAISGEGARPSAIIAALAGI
jgi:hypothetical protein